MKKIAGLLLCCMVCFLAGSCEEKEEAEEIAAEEPMPEAEEAVQLEQAPEVAVVGLWNITEWHADEIDQMEMWRVGAVTVEFRDDGSIESQLVYADGDKRSSNGTWKRSGDHLEVHITGGGEGEGDEPFERTREFTIVELTDTALLVRGEIATQDKPIVLTYKGTRAP